MTDSVDTPALLAWVREFARLVAANKQMLTELDSAIGDADHGANLDRGMTAVVAALEADAPADPAALLKKTGMTLISKVGGASGPLYGTAFLRMATSAGDASTLDPQAFAAALRAALDGVISRGKAALGDKTMVDALSPAVDALEAAVAAGKPLSSALSAAAAAAAAGRDEVTPLVARKGRASYLGERSAGHQDPGATSVTLLIEAAATAVGGA
ncbi:dihydroxyacetone kinase subunit DhaL [Actinoplanes sp. NPDC051633]|uniref:dihydroxyacetone kinase subunit DhaL n=1 Tax=Actinoplanes sp. NPDC051633 TaxID=3155670 RepID=UPI00343A308C